MPTTTKHALRYPAGIDSANIPLDMQELADDIDGKMSVYESGTLAARPAAGKSGRWYRASDGGAIYLDNGSTYDQLVKEGDARLADQRTPLDNSVVLAKMADNSVGSSEIIDAAVGAAEVNDALKPSAGAAGATEALRAIGATASTVVAGSDARLTDQRVPTDGSVTSAKIQDGAVQDTDLASPNNSVYKMLFLASSYPNPDMAAGTYLFTDQDLRASGGAAVYTFPTLRFTAADYTVAGKSQKLRVRAQVLSNATQPVITFTFGLYPITVAGGIDTLTVTLGTVVPGSTVAIASPAASTITEANSGDFTVPSDGQYAFGVVTSAQLTNNNFSQLSTQLQTRHV